MSSINDVVNSISSIQRFIPEPASRVASGFGQVLSAVGSVADTASQMVDIAPDYKALIEQQLYVQQQMQLVSLVSNNEKAKHETSMAAVRNIRGS